MAWVVSFNMFIYGGAKIIQFDDAGQIDTPVADLTGMELMWAFYGYSLPFVITLSVLEISGGILLLFKRTRLLGCLFTSTILVNVILQDIYFGVHLGALKAAVLYQFLILTILWMNRWSVWTAFRALIPNSSPSGVRYKQTIKLLLAVVLFAGLRVFEYYLTIVW